jgi:DNA polymerase (family X)
MEEKLKTIHHLGDKTYIEIAKLLEKYPDANVASLERLRWMLRDPEILPKLHVGTRADVLYNPARRISRDVMLTLEAELLKYMRLINFTIAGSFRRKKPYSRDIDIIIVTQQDIHSVIEDVLRKINNHSSRLHIYPPYQCGTDKASLIFEMLVPVDLQCRFEDLTSDGKIRIKADIFICKPEEYLYTLLFATGSGDFNVRMRAVAKRKGYLLNQRGLFQNGEKVPVSNEKHLFKILDIAYLEPEARVK